MWDRNNKEMKLGFKIILLISISVIIACSSDTNSGNGGNGNGNGNTSFSYTDIGPDLGSEWYLNTVFSGARRTDTGIWAHYSNHNSNADKLARYDFSSKQWQFWDFPMGIEDFDVWLEGEDNGTGAVVVERISSLGATQVRFLSSASPWDIEAIEWTMGNVAVGWGAGSAAFNKWLGGRSTNHKIYQETGTCCPMQWNLVDDNNLIQSYIYNMWASSRQDGYVIVTTATQSYILYGVGGSEITFGGNSYAIEHLAWDTQTRIPYALIDGILYRIEANPNSHSAQAVKVTDLTHLNYGITFGSVPLDIRNGVAFVPYDGVAVNLSNGSINTSWLGQVNMTNINDLTIMNLISVTPALFTVPNDQNSIYVYLQGVDMNTYEPYETWIRVNNAL